MSHGVAAMAFLAGLIGLGLAGCSGTAGVYNSGDEAANGSRSGVEATPEAHAGATPDQKWTHCTPGARSKDLTPGSGIRRLLAVTSTSSLIPGFR